MKNIILVLFFTFICNYSFSQVGINTDNTSPDASAMLDVKSTTKGILVPRVTTAQRTAIAMPATGLLVFDTTTASFWYYDGAEWLDLLASSINFIEDADKDTKIQVEETVDEDVIRFDLAGTEVGFFSKNASGDLLLNQNTSNVIIGSGAGGNNTGDSNVFVGREAARLNTTGRRNVVMGSQAGLALVDGELNVMIGSIAGRDNVSGSRNVCLGDSAGSGPLGNSNTYVGVATGALSGGNNNIAIGDSAGANNVAGNNNIMLGVGAGLSATGSNNILIGYFGGSSETGDNKLYIGGGTPLIYGEFDNALLRVNGSLTSTGITYPNAGIQFPNSFGPDAAYVGNTGNSISFGHAGASEDFLGYISNNFYFRDSPGGGDVTQPSVYAQGFPTYSSRRWKHDIKDLDNALSVIQKLRAVTYTWNKDQGGAKDFGFIAEEIHEVLPEIAKKNAQGEIDGVEYGKITPYLVEAVKEQQEIIENQNAEIEQLKVQNEAILKRLEALEGK